MFLHYGAGAPQNENRCGIGRFCGAMCYMCCGEAMV